MKEYYGVNPLEKRKKLIESKVAKPYIEEIIAKANEAVIAENHCLKASEFMLYSETGNRKKYEKPYFIRRSRCNHLMMAYWLTEDEKYLKPLIDYIFYICDEFTWCLPAHSSYPQTSSQYVVEHIDLFQAETARFFAEIVMCVGNKLPQYVIERMNFEVNRRIFPTIEKGVIYDWENCKMNWATVCGAGCVMAALYFGTNEQKDKYVSRFMRCLDSYLEGINDDGCCQEGVAYWNYGFFHFTVLSQAVKIHTEGKLNYFKKPKVKEIALFPQYVRLSESKVTSISDGGEDFNFKVGLMSFLKSLYPEVLLPDLKYGIIYGNVDSVFELLWFDENYSGQPRNIGTHFFSDTEWFIKQTASYGFAAKGGHNDEPHNHNDIGSFMITVGEETFISDLGCGEYVKETFMPETRYKFIQNSSRGHSVPVVCGKYQHEGKEFCASNMSISYNTFELDIEKSYKDIPVNQIHRKFEFSDEFILLSDRFEYESDNVDIIERFISKNKVKKAENGVVDFGFAKIKYNTDVCDVSLHKEYYTAHSGIEEVEVNIIDFIPKYAGEKEFEFCFVIGENF